MLGNYKSVYDLQFKQNEYGVSEEAQLVMTRDNLVNNIVRGASSVEGKASDWKKDEQFIVE
jgi:transcription initiation factor IIF auxiliary subunit